MGPHQKPDSQKIGNSARLSKIAAPERSKQKHEASLLSFSRGSLFPLI
jgi:hypothetical protein